MDILLEAGEDAPNVLMTGLVHTEDELEQTFIHPSCMPESDATALATDGPLAGQSFLGAYTWATYYLRRFVRERGSLSLQEGVHRLTGLPAQRLGRHRPRHRPRRRLGRPGRVRPGDDCRAGHAPRSRISTPPACTTCWSTADCPARRRLHHRAGGRGPAPQHLKGPSVTLLSSLRGGSLMPTTRCASLFDVKMKARDGVRFSNDVYLPRAQGPFPTIVTRTPYENSSEAFMNWGMFWAQRGYAAVRR